MSIQNQLDSVIPPGFHVRDMRQGNYQMPWGPAHTPLPGYNADTVNVSGRATGGLKQPPRKQLNPAQRLLLEGGKVGASLLASTLGFLVGGPLGAVVAGSLVSGSITAIETKLMYGQVDMVRTLWDGAWGALPGFGGFGSKIAGKLVTTKAGLFSLKATLARSYLQGFLDGGAIGFFRGGFEQFWDDYQRGFFRPGLIIEQAIKTAGFSAFFGGLFSMAGGAFARHQTHSNTRIEKGLNAMRNKRGTAKEAELPWLLRNDYTIHPASLRPSSTSVHYNRSNYDAFGATRVLGDRHAQEFFQTVVRRHKPPSTTPPVTP